MFGVIKRYKKNYVIKYLKKSAEPTVTRLVEIYVENYRVEAKSLK